jgi:hypothetical protein
VVITVVLVIVAVKVDTGLVTVAVAFTVDTITLVETDAGLFDAVDFTTTVEVTVVLRILVDADKANISH